MIFIFSPNVYYLHISPVVEELSVCSSLSCKQRLPHQSSNHENDGWRLNCRGLKALNLVWKVTVHIPSPPWNGFPYASQVGYLAQVTISLRRLIS
ncbi:hypothetical protein BDA96_04G257400 [Sorghum bicolor]|uniref:Uncharacterized protein n=2 Tax=Sorghum bicolor TaxID=4558 RepID=A0A921R5Y0_SORBI|nr:hypothetical protein BDA96_04G257400 [Sorghum bicolor]OQU85434.1 hypothetical protein SORBI_3004G241850 [Sorghum bicolor]